MIFHIIDFSLPPDCFTDFTTVFAFILRIDVSFQVCHFSFLARIRLLERAISVAFCPSVWQTHAV